MASLLDLARLSTIDTTKHAALLDKVAAAVAIKAVAIAALPTPTAAQTAWAVRALTNPKVESQVVLNYVIAENAGITTTQILDAGDTPIQNNVNDAVDRLLAL